MSVTFNLEGDRRNLKRSGTVTRIVCVSITAPLIWRNAMRKLLIATCVGALSSLAAGAANANDELIRMSQNPKDWVMPTGNYANHRYSQLNQITSENAAKLQAAWTFSTGVLRGHEGGPLVIGNVMFVHGPFPNPVFALDLNNDGKILWKYDPKQGARF